MAKNIEYPIEYHLPPDVTASTYRLAFNRLREYSMDPENKIVGHFKELSIKTSAVGDDLALLLQGGGVAIKQIAIYSRGTADELRKEHWRWTIQGNMGQYIIAAMLTPESDEVMIYKCTHKGNLYHSISVPIKTGEYSIDVNNVYSPCVIRYVNGTICDYHPSLTPNNVRVLRYYASLLHQGVSDLMHFFPDPGK
jgi:hypothetical protein